MDLIYRLAIIMGGVAQLGERLPCTQEVIGSIPFTSTIIFGFYEPNGKEAGINKPPPSSGFFEVLNNRI